MATTTLRSKFRTVLKNIWKDDSTHRIDEPDGLSRGIWVTIFGVVITGFMILMFFYMMKIDMVEWVANYLYTLNPENFTQIYAAFGSAVLAMVSSLITVIFVWFGEATHDEVIEMISDHDINMQERMVELENKLEEGLRKLEANQ